MLPRRRTARYDASIAYRRVAKDRQRASLPVSDPAALVRDLRAVQEEMAHLARAKGASRMTAAAAIIGLVAALFRLIVDAGAPLRDWWAQVMRFFRLR